MDKNNALASVMQLREQMLKATTDLARKLRSVRSAGDMPVAVITSGGLVLCDDGNKLHFGALVSHRVARGTDSIVENWNRKNPQHPVKLMRWSEALESQIVSTAIFLADIEDRRNKMENGL